MKRLLIGAALCSLVAAPALAGEPAKVTEPIKLTSTQMDWVTAGAFCFDCTNVNRTKQTAVAVAIGGGFLFGATAVAANSNETDQEIND